MLPPKEGEYRVVKHKYDAFFETDLDSILRNNRIKNSEPISKFPADADPL